LFSFVGIIASSQEFATADEVIQLVQDAGDVVARINVTNVTKEDVEETDMTMEQLQVKISYITATLDMLIHNAPIKWQKKLFFVPTYNSSVTITCINCLFTGGQRLAKE
jgi:hypothetical protein